eukprot:2041843-Lingulodinium_polyedra.AAC.1
MLLRYLSACGLGCILRCSESLGGPGVSDARLSGRDASCSGPREGPETGARKRKYVQVYVCKWSR